MRKSTRRRAARIGLVSLHLVLLGATLTFVLSNPSSDDTTKTPVANMGLNASSAIAAPLDQLSAVDIAQTASIMAGLPETPLINGQVVAEETRVKRGTPLATSITAAKPIPVKTEFNSNKDIKTYVVKLGDTVGSIAAKFGVSSDSIRWSNNLAGNAVNVDTKLQIPPVNGFLYKVQSGDTPQSLAQAFNADKNLIIAYNDAEIKGLKVGELIIIPGGQKPDPSPSYYGAGYSVSYGYGGWGVYGNYNLYDLYNCTWWVAKRWAETGRPIMPLLGNASQWYYNAERLNLAHGTTPKAHAAAVTNTYGWGHVVFVESLNADGSINISEMNVDGWASSKVWYSTVPASEARSYLYVY